MVSCLRLSAASQPRRQRGWGYESVSCQLSAGPRNPTGLVDGDPSSHACQHSPWVTSQIQTINGNPRNLRVGPGKLRPWDGGCVNGTMSLYPNRRSETPTDKEAVNGIVRLINQATEYICRYQLTKRPCILPLSSSRRVRETASHARGTCSSALSKWLRFEDPGLSDLKGLPKHLRAKRCSIDKPPKQCPRW